MFAYRTICWKYQRSRDESNPTLGRKEIVQKGDQRDGHLTRKNEEKQPSSRIAVKIVKRVKRITVGENLGKEIVENSGVSTKEGECRSDKDRAKKSWE